MQDCKGRSGKNAIESSSDNYLKLKRPEVENQWVSNSDGHMIIKLAYYNEQEQEEEIRACCESNCSTFIPLIENKFGILNARPYDIEYGCDSSCAPEQFGMTAFIEIHKCVEKKEFNRNKYKFWKKSVDPYIGELLDNKFFFNIFNFVVSEMQDIIRINLLNYINEYASEDHIDRREDIERLFSEYEEMRVKSLSLRIQNQDIVINKNGHIDIQCPDLEYFRINADLIKKILIVGFKGDHG